MDFIDMDTYLHLVLYLFFSWYFMETVTMNLHSWSDVLHACRLSFSSIMYSICITSLMASSGSDLKFYSTHPLESSVLAFWSGELAVSSRETVMGLHDFGHGVKDTRAKLSFLPTYMSPIVGSGAVTFKKGVAWVPGQGSRIPDWGALYQHSEFQQGGRTKDYLTKAVKTVKIISIPKKYQF